MSQRSGLRGATVPAAVGSMVSLGAQALMALFLLKLFEPHAVGVFSVIAQMAFGWATLALAQSPLSLLANQHLPALPAARLAMLSSLRRWAWLAPIAALAAAWFSPGVQDWGQALLWSACMAIAQMGWLLAQSLSLRIHSPVSIALVRLIPPVTAATLAAIGALWLHWRSSSVLTSAALTGYALGALWLLVPLLQAAAQAPITAHRPQADERSERLKFIHTLSDVLVSTVLAAHWSASYGPAQAACLLMLLRVMGFIPALVSTAWAQVMLSRSQLAGPSSALAAWAGSAAIVALGLSIGLALQAGWLASGWAALQGYIAPVVFWQIGASLIAAFSHLPFQRGKSVTYSRQCMAINAVQILLTLLPPLLGWSLTSHLWALCGFLGLALSLQALWAARL